MMDVTTTMHGFPLTGGNGAASQALHQWTVVKLLFIGPGQSLKVRPRLFVAQTSPDPLVVTYTVYAHRIHTCTFCLFVWWVNLRARSKGQAQEINWLWRFQPLSPRISANH